MTDLHTPEGPGDDSEGTDPRLVAALRVLGRAESAAPDDLTRRRHLRSMRRAVSRRRSVTALAGAAAVIALVAGTAVLGTRGDRGTTRTAEPLRNLVGTVDSVAPIALPMFEEESEITTVPFERTEEYVILEVATENLADIREQLTASLGRNIPTVGRTTTATTFVVPASIARTITATTGISAFPDTPVSAVAEQTPVPSWGLDRIDALDAPLDDTYSWSNSGTGSIVYVVDTGVYASHSDLAGRVVAGYSAVGDGNGTNDCHGHGTHVAGTVAGTRFGVAKSSTVVAVRVLDCNGSGYTSGVIAGINWVVANHPGGRGIINLSLGGPANSALDSAVADATAAGLVVAVAAGNESADACSYSPARAPSALTVGATNRDDSRASYSNSGSCVDMWAPGSQITSAWISGSTASETISGTSMASPHVAGLAARMLSMNPSLTVNDIRSRLVRKSGSSATPVVNFVEEPGDAVSPTTTTVVGTTTTAPPTDSTPVPTTTTVTPTTTVPPSTLPKRGRSGDTPRERKTTQPKQFVMTWDTGNNGMALVASWLVDSVQDRYTIDCEGGNGSSSTSIEFDESTVSTTSDGRSLTTLSLTPRSSLRCRLTGHVGSDSGRPSNTAVVPPAPRRPITSTTAPATTVPVTETTVAPGTEPTTTTVAPQNQRPLTTTTTRPEPTTTVRPPNVPGPQRPVTTTVKDKNKNG